MCASSQAGMVLPHLFPCPPPLVHTTSLPVAAPAIGLGLAGGSARRWILLSFSFSSQPQQQPQPQHITDRASVRGVTSPTRATHHPPGQLLHQLRLPLLATSTSQQQHKQAGSLQHVPSLHISTQRSHNVLMHICIFLSITVPAHIALLRIPVPHLVCTSPFSPPFPIHHTFNYTTTHPVPDLLFLSSFAAPHGNLSASHKCSHLLRLAVPRRPLALLQVP